MFEAISAQSGVLIPGVLLVTALILFFYWGSQKPKGYPPGPKWWPILGSALEVERLRKKTGYLYETFAILYKRYGPVVGLKIGKDRIVILNTYESWRSMAQNEDCDGRPTGPVYQTRTWGERKGVLVVDGQFWVEQRRFCLRHLRELGFGRTTMASIVEDEAFHLIKHFKETIDSQHASDMENMNRANNNNGQIYKLADEIMNANNADSNQESTKICDAYVKPENYMGSKLKSKSAVFWMNSAFGVPVLNSIWKLLTGKRFENNDKDCVYLQSILTKLLNEIDMIGCPFSHFPFLRYIAPEKSGYKFFYETHSQLWKFLREEIELHKENFNPNSLENLMDVYLAMLKSEEATDSFSESQLLGICVDIFIAGSETTSKTLAFCFLYLTLYQDVQRKAQEEIDRVLGPNKMPTLNDRPRMPYVSAIVQESLRMFMGRTLNVPHRAMRDTEINGHKIPKDTMIVVNVNRVLMDESWGDPEAFRPERFLDDEGRIDCPDQHTPFGIGRHRCMGETLARSNLFIITAALLQAFTFSPVPGKELKLEFVDGVTAGPKPYQVLVSRRS